ncbi:sigma-70 family RNA polymerase sigma factor [Haloferula sp. BvORR071]|uniref:RNA polymerase sigma factor n=1 Tax=Haloferula sp. BvORR071 TaxID=1396141 RepID=UPI0005583A64|nr:sigma-70 family RNA polymerase sigma factor [Haloferula sp. BvORR071]
MEIYSEISGASDGELLRNWLEGQREAAFRALVRRYSGLALMTARRSCGGDDSLAAEAAQLTFILLARKAPELLGCASLGGWVHRTALLQARNLLRTAQREQRKRSQLLHASMGPGAFSAGDRWQALQPMLDESLEALPAKDREALLLRFYRALGVREVGTALGISREAAQKRIDRASEKLRAQILRRGGSLAGITVTSLGTTLAAGFGAEAQAGAALPLAAGFAKTALASAGAASSSTGTSLFLSSMGMKASSMVAVPLVALLVGGVWFASQRLAIGKLEEENAALAGKMTLASGAASTAAKPKTLLPTALDQRPVDWKAVGAALAQVGAPKGSLRYLNDSLALREQIRDMNREQVLEALAEVDALVVKASFMHDDDVGEMTFAFNALYASLAAKDPRAAIERSMAKDRPEQVRYKVILEEWVKKDAASAGEWVDALFAEKKKGDSKARNEARRSASELFYALLRDHPEDASRRAAALPEGERTLLLRQDFEVLELPEEDQAAFAGILREHFGDSSRQAAIARTFLGRVYTDKSQTLSYAQLENYLQRIEARPDEIAACIRGLAEAGRFERSGSGPAGLKDIETLRAWTEEHTAGERPKVIAAALSNSLTPANYAELAEYALERHAAGDGDAVFRPFFQPPLSRNRRELAQRMLEKVTDESLRSEAQEGLSR